MALLGLRSPLTPRPERIVQIRLRAGRAASKTILSGSEFSPMKREFVEPKAVPLACLSV